jgi:hypothetical protein
MFELFKLAWDFIVLRNEAKHGRLKTRMFVLAGAFLLVLYGIVLPAGLYYINHPNYLPLLVAAIVLAAASFITVVWLGLAWRRQDIRAELSKGN